MRMNIVDKRIRMMTVNGWRRTEVEYVQITVASCFFVESVFQNLRKKKNVSFILITDF